MQILSKQMKTFYTMQIKFPLNPPSPFEASISWLAFATSAAAAAADFAA
jgi:hypothetical protein